jgi:hypothetical protein
MKLTYKDEGHWRGPNQILLILSRDAKHRESKDARSGGPSCPAT